MSKITWLTVLAIFISAAMAPADAQHQDTNHDLEEMIVTAPISKKESDTAMPVNVLSGETLSENAGSTLGDTLNGLIGVTSTSFGPGVGSPVIRGQSGNRVGVLQDGLGTLDVSSISQDHANNVEPLLAERIEVVRGPSTLLYGNSAIGGIVNIIDNRIPEAMPETLKGAAELRHDSTADENAGVFRLDGGYGSCAWHLDGLQRERDNVKIPGFAISGTPAQQAAGSKGFIDNSAAESSSLTAGTSFIAEAGFIGASISLLDNNYGIAPRLPEGGTTTDIRIDMEQTRFNIKGRLDMGGFFKSLEASVAVNDYQHKELEIAGGETDVGTIFKNEGMEARLLLYHQDIGNINGVFGTQFDSREFSATGEESFIPASDIHSRGLFAVESIDADTWLYEFGARFNNHTVEPSSSCRSDKNTWSGSASAIRRLRDDTNLLFSFTRSERAATVEELYSNIEIDTCRGPADPAGLVAHEPTGRFEIGDPELDTESSQNLELALRKYAGKIRGEFNLFHNKTGDYIYLADSGVEFEGTGISRYLQQDVTFSGAEAEITFPFETSAGNHLDLTLLGDYVRAEFNDGSNVPRIPPMRLGAEIAWLKAAWSFKLRGTRTDGQKRTGDNETATAGNMLVDLYFDYHLQPDGSEITVFIKANNLLDENIRNHTSLIKDFAPEPGRGVQAGLRYQF